MLTGYTAALERNPLLFMRTHAVHPPSTDGTLADIGTDVLPPPPPSSSWTPALAGGRTPWKKATYNVKSTKTDMGVAKRDNTGGMRFVQVVERQGPGSNGTLTLRFSANPAGDNTYTPIYWLPWYSLKLMGTRIPAIPPGGNPDNFPKLFFTAGLSGCSVFAHGNPESPTVTHAGVDGVSTPYDPKDFWLDQMDKTRTGYSSANIKGAIDANMYAQRSDYANALAKAYLQFIQGGSKSSFELDVTSTIGCVFGIRTGRNWTLYLQKIATFSKVKFLKKDEVIERKSGGQSGGQTFFNAKSDNAPVTVSAGAQKKLGPITLPGKLSSILPGKPSKIYSTTSQWALPLEVVKFYPTTGFVADFKDTFKGS